MTHVQAQPVQMNAGMSVIWNDLCSLEDAEVVFNVYSAEHSLCQVVVKISSVQMHSLHFYKKNCLKTSGTSANVAVSLHANILCLTDNNHEHQLGTKQGDIQTSDLS